MTNEKKKLVPEKTKPKYQPPQVISLGDRNEGAGATCTDGSSNYTWCQQGSGATSICWSGNAANSCDTGSSR